MFVFAGLALGLLAAAPTCDRGTTYDMRMCWSAQDEAAIAELNSTYAKAIAFFRKSGVSTEPLAAAEAAWVAARDKTCAFEFELYVPGTIAPQIGIECDLRITRARTQRLSALLTSTARSPEQPVSPAAQAQLDRVHGRYDAYLTKPQQSALAAAQRAWTAYRDKDCAIEGGSCLTELTNERVAELKASWVGEADIL